MYQPDDVIIPPRNCVHMSDRASQEYISSQIDSDHKPSQWMVDQELSNNNLEDLKPHDDVEGEVENVVKVKPDCEVNQDGE
jgi:hypothetical protein